MCSQPGCERPAYTRGLCRTHITRVYRHGDPSVSLRNREHDGRCVVSGCDRPYYGKGLCKWHADAQRNYGPAALSPELVPTPGRPCDLCFAVPTGRAALVIDHDHRTGRIRGLICNPCNAGLGMFRDNPRLLRSAAAYVEGLFAPPYLFSPIAPEGAVA